MTASKFKLGDRVYAPHFGEGIITDIDERASPFYPIIVEWTKELQPCRRLRDVYTIEGLYAVSYHDSEFDISKVKKDEEATTFGVWLNHAKDYALMRLKKRKARNKEKEREEMKEDTKYKVGDRVYAPFHGYGVVTEIKDDGQEYPIVVTWDEKKHGCSASIFTPDGSAFKGLDSDDDDITLVEKASPKKDEKEGKFKVGDRVRSFHFGVGIVESVSGDNMQYPIAVKWTDNSKAHNTYDYFTKDGEFDCENPSMKNIVPLEIIDRAKGEEDTGVVDRMMDALEKKTDEAVNPKHYHVEGIPEAIYLMTRLMNKEQLEGFLWGNIVKYAYRYGRKGDKAETAGKIAWYAKRLEEVLKGEHNEA